MSTGTDLPPHLRPSHGGDPHRRRRRHRRGPLGKLRRLFRRKRRGFEGLERGFASGGSRHGSSGRRRSGLDRRFDHRGRRRSGRLRWVVLGGFLLLLGLGAAIVDAFYTSAKAVSDLDEVATTLSAAKAGLLKGRLPRNDPFGQAAAAVAEVRATIDGARPTFGLIGALPFVGRPVVAARELVEATEAEVRAALGTRDLLQDLLGDALAQDPGTDPGGGGGTPPDRVQCEDLEGEERERCREEREQAEGQGGGGTDQPPAGAQSPIFADGKFDLARLKGFLPQLEAIVADLRAAEAAVLEVPTAPFIDKVAELKAEILDEVSDARRLGENALAGMRFLPELLGDEGERRYLVAFGDLSYLRGAGGSTLAIAVMSADDGRIELSPATQVFRFFDDQVDYDVPVPEGNWYLHELPLTRRLGNANWSPHFPSSAAVMADLYELVAQQEGIDDLPLDGVIQVDAPAVAMMLKATGPIQVAQWPDPIDSRNVAEVAYIDSHLELDGRTRKDFAAALVSEAWERIGSPRSAESLLVSVIQLGKALQTKHVQIWFADRPEQELAADLGWTGGLRQDPGDYLLVAEDNLETDALDFFAEQSVEHDVTIAEDGSLEVVTTVRMTVELPEGEEYRTPPISSPRGPTKKTMVNLYVPEGATLVDVLFDDAGGRGSIAPCPEGVGKADCVRNHVEQGRRTFTATLESPPGEETSLIFRYTVPDGLVEISGGPAYRLTMQAQPKMNLDSLKLVLHLPEGWTVRGDPHRFEMSADGTTATLEKVVEKDFATQLLLEAP